MTFKAQKGMRNHTFLDTIKEKYRTKKAYKLFFLLTGDMLGLGSLTLPSVFARLGWVPALAIIAICALGTIYSGRLFTLLVEKAGCPAPCSS